ncbi:hypothetical protein ABIA35_000104 [Catenulispora sp. MAP12-49]|uniref:hypothetical protein n=1 Tax=Catenulispora sp. MAP12-49 TaxID=3156302 RepID=UPI0035165BB3
MRNDKLTRLLGPLGLGAVVAFVIGFLILNDNNVPGKNASAAAVVSYYQTHSMRETWSLYIIAAGVILMAFFIGGMRTVLRKANEAHSWLADTALAGGILFIAGFSTTGFLQWTLISAAHNGQAQLAGNLNFLSQSIQLPAQAGIVVLAAAAGLAIVLGSDIPAWLGYVALAIAVVAAIGPIGLIGVLVMPIWMTLFGFVVGARTAPRTVGGQRPAMGHRMTLRHHH